MLRSQQRTNDKVRKLADLTNELRDKTGVQSVTPVEKGGLDGHIETVQSMLNAGSTEIKDLMDRPRVTAAEDCDRKFQDRETQKILRGNGRVSARVRRWIN